MRCASRTRAACVNGASQARRAALYTGFPPLRVRAVHAPTVSWTLPSSTPPPVR